MKRKFIFTLCALTALILMTQSFSLEARGHHHCGPRVQINLGNCYGGCRDAYVVRRVARPVVVAPVAPVVYAPQAYYAPVYVAPTTPAYVEEVYVAPKPRPFSFAGLSFSWNFFR